MHDLISILLAELVFKLLLKLLIIVLHFVLQFLELGPWAEWLGARVLEGLLALKVADVLVIPQIHVEVQLLSVHSCLEHVPKIISITNKVNITVGGRIDRLPGLPSLEHFLEL